jgi:hypothetical protein
MNFEPNKPPSLRRLLRANAVFASGTGLVAIAATGPIARLVGVNEHRLVTFTGANLLLFAIGLLVISGSTGARLARSGRLISMLDASWVVATGFVVVLGDLPARGELVLGMVAFVVGTFAAAQWRAAGADDLDDVQTAEVTQTLDGNVDDVWAVVIDHAHYGELAPNLSRVMPTAPDGPDLTRRCWDTRGRQWDESCVLWEDRRRFAVIVDTQADDYPYPLEFLRGEWAVEPVGTDKTNVTVQFELRPKPGPVGAAFALAMTAAAKPLIRKITNGWQHAVTTTAAAAAHAE